MRSAFLTVLALGVLGGCNAGPPRSAGSVEPSTLGEPARPTHPVQLQRDVLPILASGCSGEYCHGAAMTTAAGARAYLVNQPAEQCDDGRPLVAPGHPERSYLVDKVLGRRLCAGNPMPRGVSNELSPQQIAMLIDWIREGAPPD